VWAGASNVSLSAGTSCEAHIEGAAILGEPVILWADATGGNYDIRYKLPISGVSGSFPPTSEPSHHPSFTTRQVGVNLRVLALWTEGGQSPYEVRSAWKDVIPLLGKMGSEHASHEQPSTDASRCSIVACYPNPFNPVTSIVFTLAEPSIVELKVFDLLGSGVAVLVDGPIGAGSHEARWDAGDLSSGVYLARIRVQDGQGRVLGLAMTKLLLMR
jgi:hypothetical protein